MSLVADLPEAEGAGGEHFVAGGFDRRIRITPETLRKAFNPFLCHQVCRQGHGAGGVSEWFEDSAAPFISSAFESPAAPAF